MSGRGADEVTGMRREFERGLTDAWQAHFADATAHFARARDQVPSHLGYLVTALDAFIQSHARYWQAEQALHEASQRFAVANSEQQVRLEDLQNLLATLGPGRDELLEPGTVADPAASAGDGPGLHATGQGDETSLPPLSITCFGGFTVRRAGRAVTLCQNRNGQAILRYLAAQPRHSETMDTLVEALWPDDPPEVGRHKLHVAVSALRRALNGTYAQRKGTGYLLHHDGIYQLNPMVTIQIDVEDFLTLFRAGQHTGGHGAVPHFEAACHLYTGPFLPEDLYADWSLIQREQLTQIYLTMCNALATHYLGIGRHEEAVKWATACLEENRCDEVAYRQLMSAHAGTGRRSEALRLYQRCERVLAEELGVQPMPETKAIFHAVLHGEPEPSVPASGGDEAHTFSKQESSEARSA